MPDRLAPLSLLVETAESWGIALTLPQQAQFATYATSLQQWNHRMNLTAITDMESIVTRHFLDSLRCAGVWGESAPRALLDVGSGAGFPGLPLKIAFPGLRVVLVESVGKKAVFLHHVVREMGLEGVEVLQERAESVGQMAQHREHYDLVVARAVARLSVLAEYCLPLVRVGGRFLAPKGAASSLESELAEAQRALAQCGGHLLAVEPVVLPGLDPRSLVVVEKVAPTPAAYPRATGVPSRRSL